MSSSSAQMKEARLMVRMRQAHSMALQRTAGKLGPEVLKKPVKSIEGNVGDTDPAALAAKVVAQVVAKSEEAFGQLCERMSVNERLLALERAKEQQQLLRQQQQQRAKDFTLGDSSISPLPGGRRPAELVRESTMKLKLAERARLLALAEEAERSADEEGAKVAAIEAQIEQKLGEVAATQQALAEASSSIR